MSIVQESNSRLPVIDKREARIKQMFGSIAPVYDLLNHLLSLNIDKLWRLFAGRVSEDELVQVMESEDQAPGAAHATSTEIKAAS